MEAEEKVAVEVPLALVVAALEIAVAQEQKIAAAMLEALEEPTLVVVAAELTDLLTVEVTAVAV